MDTETPLASPRRLSPAEPRRVPAYGPRFARARPHLCADTPDYRTDRDCSILRRLHRGPVVDHSAGVTSDVSSLTIVLGGAPLALVSMESPPPIREGIRRVRVRPPEAPWDLPRTLRDGPRAARREQARPLRPDALSPVPPGQRRSDRAGESRSAGLKTSVARPRQVRMSRSCMRGTSHAARHHAPRMSEVAWRKEPMRRSAGWPGA